MKLFVLWRQNDTYMATNFLAFFYYISRAGNIISLGLGSGREEMVPVSAGLTLTIAVPQAEGLRYLEVFE